MWHVEKEPRSKMESFAFKAANQDLTAVSLLPKIIFKQLNWNFPISMWSNLQNKTPAIPFLKKMTCLKTILCLLLLTSSLPMFQLPIKTFCFVQLLQSPFYLLEGMLPNSRVVKKKKRKLDLQSYLIEFMFFNRLLKNVWNMWLMLWVWSFSYLFNFFLPTESLI